MHTPSSRRRTAAAVACVLLLPACAQDQAAPTDLVGEPRPVEVGTVEPSPLQLTSPAPEQTAADGADSDGADSGDGATGSDDGATPGDGQPSTQPSPSVAPSPTTAGPARPTAVTLLAVADREGDHGVRAPDWADLVGVEMVDRGDAFTITARFGAALPVPAPEGEVMLISFDVGEQDERGRGYQLFVVGNNAGGWLAYYFVPEDDEPQPFPDDGVFSISGSTLTIGVDWNDVGSPTRGPLEVLASWSRNEDGLLGAINPSSDDELDRQPHGFDRNP